MGHMESPQDRDHLPVLADSCRPVWGAAEDEGQLLQCLLGVESMSSDPAGLGVKVQPQLQSGDPFSGGCCDGVAGSWPPESLA